MAVIPDSFWDEEYRVRTQVEQMNLNLSTYAVFDAEMPYNSNGEERYYMGIIDILQPYTFRKRMETFFKTLRNRKQRHEISAVPPVEYKMRFCDFIASLT